MDDTDLRDILGREKQNVILYLTALIEIYEASVTSLPENSPRIQAGRNRLETLKQALFIVESTTFNKPA